MSLVYLGTPVCHNLPLHAAVCRLLVLLETPHFYHALHAAVCPLLIQLEMSCLERPEALEPTLTCPSLGSLVGRCRGMSVEIVHTGVQPTCL